MAPSVDSYHGDLVEHLTRSTTLDRAQAHRVLADVVAYFSETLDEQVRRRHRELQRAGLSNDAIFARLGVELDSWRLRAPRLSARQLRRIVYG